MAASTKRPLPKSSLRGQASSLPDRRSLEPAIRNARRGGCEPPSPAHRHHIAHDRHAYRAHQTHHRPGAICGDGLHGRGVLRKLFRLVRDWTNRQAEGVQLPVIEAHCEYRRAAKYDDELEIRTRAALLTPVRIRFDYEIARGE